MGPCQQGVLKWHSIWSSCQPCQRNCQISTGTVIKISRASYLKDPPPFVFRTSKALFQSFPLNFLFYQDCLLADRGSAIYAAYDARSREEAMDYETEHSASGKHNGILCVAYKTMSESFII